MTDPTASNRILEYLSRDGASDTRSDTVASFPDPAPAAVQSAMQGVLAGVQAAIRGEDVGEPPADDAFVQRLMARVAEQPAEAPRVTAGRPALTCGASHLTPARSRVPRVLAYTTAALALGVVAFFARPLARTISSEQLGDQRTYTTERGQQATISLPDGSRVVLAPGTRVTYAAAASGARTVTLDGQAYFTVTHDGDRPFTVVAGTVHTRVLGTAFSVRAYATDRTQRVAVAEGKVSVANGRASVVLLPGDIGDVTAGHAPVITHDVTVAQAFGWMRGQLAFDGAPLRDVVVDLARVYDVDIVITNPALAAQPVTMTFTGEPIAEIVKAIALATNATVVHDGRSIRLVPAS